MSKISITPNASGTGVFTIASPATNTNRTLTLPDEAGTMLTSASSITQNAGPVCAVYRTGSQQSMTQNSYTTLAFNATLIDTDNAWDNSNYWFKPSVAGYYYLNMQFQAGGTDPTRSIIHFRRNGSGTVEWAAQTFDIPQTQYALAASTFMYLNGTTDYASVVFYTPTAGVTFADCPDTTARISYLRAILLRAA